MNRHTKLALLILPFLMIGGYIASDFYIEHEAQQQKVFQLNPVGHCDVLQQKCILKSGEFEVNVYHKLGVTTLNSTFPVDSVILFLVNEKSDKKNNATAYPMGMLSNPYYWQVKTPLRALLFQKLTDNKVDTTVDNTVDKKVKYKLRLIINIKGGQYISEFYTFSSSLLPEFSSVLSSAQSSELPIKRTD